MTRLEFIAAVIDSLAWPAVVIMTVVLLRRPLAGLLPLLRRVKYKELEVEFAQEVKELRQEAEAALPLSLLALRLRFRKNRHSSILPRCRPARQLSKPGVLLNRRLDGASRRAVKGWSLVDLSPVLDSRVRFCNEKCSIMLRVACSTA